MILKGKVSGQKTGKLEIGCTWACEQIAEVERQPTAGEADPGSVEQAELQDRKKSIATSGPHGEQGRKCCPGARVGRIPFDADKRDLITGNQRRCGFCTARNGCCKYQRARN